jgi:hypothetical protein
MDGPNTLTALLHAVVVCKLALVPFEFSQATVEPRAQLCLKPRNATANHAMPRAHLALGLLFRNALYPVEEVSRLALVFNFLAPMANVVLSHMMFPATSILVQKTARSVLGVLSVHAA